MTAFARSDVMTITIPRDAGGCGEPHSRPVENEAATKRKRDPEDPIFAEEFGVTCPACEPILLSVHGWAKSHEDRELTPDEEKLRERLEKEGEVAMRVMAGEMGRQLTESVRAGLAGKA